MPKKRIPHNLKAFLVPFLLMLLAYILFGIYPFGTRSILITDMESQYVDFYAYLRHVIYDGSGLWFSWSKGPGMNMAGLFAYYLASPLSLIVALFPQKNIPEALMFMTLVKAGLCGLTFSVYQKTLYGERDNASLAFSTMYALMSYTAVYFWCPMWQDAVIMTPLIMMGIEKILRGERTLFLTVSFAALAISNYYTAYMVALFSALYFVYRFLCVNGGAPVKVPSVRTALSAAAGLAAAFLSVLALIGFVFKVPPGWYGGFISFLRLNELSETVMRLFRLAEPPKTAEVVFSSAALAAWAGFFVLVRKRFPVGRFFRQLGFTAAAGLIGAALAAWLILPAYKDYAVGKALMGSYIPEEFFNQSINEFAGGLFNGQFTGLTNKGTPAVYCGALCILLCVLYFANGKIKLREKIAAFLILAVFVACFIVREADMVWHVFSYPNWFPYRYAFLFCFFTVQLAYRCFRNIDGIGKYTKAVASVAVLNVLLIIMLSPLLKIRLWGWTPDFRINPWGFVTVVLVQVFAVLIFLAPKKAGAAIALLVCADLLANTYAVFGLIDGQPVPFKFALREKYAVTERVEEAVKEIRREDGGFYRTEKTFERSRNDPMNMGYNGLSHYSSNFNKRFNEFNRGMGMNQNWYACVYIGSTVVTDSLLGVRYVLSRDIPNDIYEKVYDGDTFGGYKNPSALPIGYVTGSGVIGGKYDAGNYFRNQNAVLRHMGAPECFAILDGVEKSGGGFNFTAADDKPVYFMMNGESEATPVINVDGESRAYGHDRNKQKIYFLGRFLPGQHVSVSLGNEKEDNVRSAVCASFDGIAFAEWADSVPVLEISRISNGRVEGTVDLPENSVLFTSIPYDEGWKAYADGKRTDTSVALGAFVAVELPPGSHEIKLVFTPPGLVLGSCISAVTLIGLAGYGIIKKRSA